MGILKWYPAIFVLDKFTGQGWYPSPSVWKAGVDSVGWRVQRMDGSWTWIRRTSRKGSVIDNTGSKAELDLTLHGKIQNAASNYRVIVIRHLMNPFGGPYLKASFMAQSEIGTEISTLPTARKNFNSPIKLQMKDPPFDSRLSWQLWFIDFEEGALILPTTRKISQWMKTPPSRLTHGKLIADPPRALSKKSICLNLSPIWTPPPWPY